MARKINDTEIVDQFSFSEQLFRLNLWVYNYLNNHRAVSAQGRQRGGTAKPLGLGTHSLPHSQFSVFLTLDIYRLKYLVHSIVPCVPWLLLPFTFERYILLILLSPFICSTCPKLLSDPFLILLKPLAFFANLRITRAIIHGPTTHPQIHRDLILHQFGLDHWY